jgi:glycosyltransferase involved in cell wall biosynthesis
MIVLSICIPTYNRAPRLNAVLEAISNEIKLFPNEWRASIEVCISDNGSTDKTQNVIAKWKKRLHISSSRNATNMGYDVNAVKAIQLAKGKFAMCMGDDDTFVKGSLERLVEKLVKYGDYNFGAIYLNSLKNGTRETAFGCPEFRVYRKDDVYSPLSLSFGGSVCLRTKTAKAIIKETIYFENGKLCKHGKDKFLLSEFVHTYLFLECVSRSGSLGIEPKCVVEVQGKGQSISIAKRFYFALIFNLYYLQIRENYPWVKEAIFLEEGVVNHIFKKYLALSYLLNNRPDLTDAFNSNYALSLKILKDSPEWAFLLVVLEKIRKVGFLNLPLALCIDMIRVLSGKNDFLRENADTVGTPSKAVEDLFARAKKYQGIV